MTRISARIVAAEPVDQLAAMRTGARLFLAECSTPDVQRIVLIDAPAVLGWERWREVGMKYGLGVIEAMLAQAMADGAIPDAAAAPDGARPAGRARRGRPLRIEGHRRRRGAARDVRGVRPCDQRHRRRPLTGQRSPGTMSFEGHPKQCRRRRGSTPARPGTRRVTWTEGVAPSRPNCAEPPFWAPWSCFCCFWSAPVTSRASSNPSPPPASSSCPRDGGSHRRAT